MTTITKETNPRDLFNLLDSNDFSIVDQIVQLINDSLNNTKESWLMNSLVDYYFLSESNTARDIISSVREPNDKHLMDKLTESMKSPETRLIASRLLLHVVCKQPYWIHKLVDSSLFSAVIKSLKTDTDVVLLMTCLMVVINYLPMQPTMLSNQLWIDVCEIFSRLVSMCLYKHGQTTEVYLLYLHTSVYTLFHRLYSMYPCNFLDFLRHHYIKKENIAAYEEAIKPMLERVRLHPRLVTGTRDSEMNASRWKKMEVQDIVVDCARMSLDMIEGTGESCECPAVMSRWNPALPSMCDHKPTSPINQETEVVIVKRLPEQSDVTTSVLWSPSVICGLSTPPPVQLTPSQPPHHTSTHSTFASTPLFTTADNTPRATPIDDIFDKSVSSRNQSSRGYRDLPSRLAPVNYQSDIHSTPTSPLKPNFTADPPPGTRRANPRNSATAAVQLDFGTSSLETSLERSGVLKDKLQTVRADSEVGQEVVTDTADDARDSLPTIDDVAYILPTQDNVDSMDREVSELTGECEDGQDAASVSSSDGDGDGDEDSRQSTAASVKQFMKNVNRIRFNSLTVTSSEFVTIGRSGLRKKFSSCPQLVTLVAECEDEEIDALRSASLMVQADNVAQPGSGTVTPSLTTTTASTNTLNNSLSTVTEATTALSSKTPLVKPHCVLSKSASKGAILERISEPLPTPTQPPPQQSQPPPTKPATTTCEKCKDIPHINLPAVSLHRHEPLFSTLSPPELLDRHLNLGGDIHTKELSKLPMTSGQTVNWTHFGGLPPLDEVNILRTQLSLLQNQLMYERHKRELHSQRNRRLLHKITHAKSTEEASVAMIDQVKQQDNEIHNLQVSLKLLHEQNEQLYRAKEGSENNKQIRAQGEEIESLKYGTKELQTMIVNQKKENDLLKQRLQESQYELFNCRTTIASLNDRVSATKELKQQVTDLNKELLLKGEIHQRYQEQMTAKLQHQARPENEYLLQSLRLDKIRLETQLEQSHVTGSANHNRAQEMEEALKCKELALVELKKRLEYVTTTRNDQIAAVEAKYRSVMKVNQQLESYILDLYSRLDHGSEQSAHRVPPAIPGPHSTSPSLLRSQSDSPSRPHHPHPPPSTSEPVVTSNHDSTERFFNKFPHQDNVVGYSRSHDSNVVEYNRSQDSGNVGVYSRSHDSSGIVKCARSQDRVSGDTTQYSRSHNINLCMKLGDIRIDSRDSNLSQDSMMRYSVRDSDARDSGLKDSVVGDSSLRDSDLRDSKSRVSQSSRDELRDSSQSGNSKLSDNQSQNSQLRDSQSSDDRLRASQVRDNTLQRSEFRDGRLIDSQLLDNQPGDRIGGNFMDSQDSHLGEDEQRQHARELGDSGVRTGGHNSRENPDEALEFTDINDLDSTSYSSLPPGDVETGFSHELGYVRRGTNGEVIVANRRATTMTNTSGTLSDSGSVMY